MWRMLALLAASYVLLGVATADTVTNSLDIIAWVAVTVMVIFSAARLPWFLAGGR